jgi:hypothetical protein
MSQRSQEIIKRIKKASKLAGDPGLDLNRNQVETERQKVMKTFKEFVEAVTPSRFVPGESNYGDPGYQERLTKERQKEKKEKEKEQESRHKKLYDERKERGIRATNKQGVKGWIKKGVFTAGDW